MTTRNLFFILPLCVLPFLVSCDHVKHGDATQTEQRALMDTFTLEVYDGPGGLRPFVCGSINSSRIVAQVSPGNVSIDFFVSRDCAQGEIKVCSRNYSPPSVNFADLVSRLSFGTGANIAISDGSPQWIHISDAQTDRRYYTINSILIVAGEPYVLNPNLVTDPLFQLVSDCSLP